MTEHLAAKPAKSCPVEIILPEEQQTDNEKPKKGNEAPPAKPPARRIFTVGGQGGEEEEDIRRSSELLRIPNPYKYSIDLGKGDHKSVCGVDLSFPANFDPCTLTPCPIIISSDSANDDIGLQDKDNETKCQQVDLFLDAEETQTVLETFQHARKTLEDLTSQKMSKIEQLGDENKKDEREWELLSQDISFIDSPDIDNSQHSILHVFRRHRPQHASNSRTATVYKFAQLQVVAISNAFSADTSIDEISLSDDNKLQQEQPHCSSSLPPALLSPTSRKNSRASQIRKASLTVEKPLEFASGSLFCMPNVFDDKEVNILWDSFNLVKCDARELGSNAIHKIAATVPGSFERLIPSPCDEGPSLGDGQWESIQLGLIFLNGIERCILRLKRPTVLQRYMKQLVIDHIKTRSVSAVKMTAALNIFGLVIVDFLQTKHSHETIEKKDQPCTICALWARFFGLISFLIISTENAAIYSSD